MLGGTASGRILPPSAELKESLCKCAVMARSDDAVHDAVISRIQYHNKTRQNHHAQQLCLSDLAHKTRASRGKVPSIGETRPKCTWANVAPILYTHI